MQRVLIFSLAYYPFIGGAEIAIKEITDRLPDFEFDMITVNLDGKKNCEERIGRVNVLRLGKWKISKYIFPWQALALAGQLHKKSGYDAIWGMMANQAGLAASIFKLSHPEVPYLLTLQEGDSNFDIWLRTWFMRSMYKSIYRRADYIQAISNFLAERAKKMGAKCPIEVVPNGVIPTNYECKRITNSEKKVIITVSRLEKKNGVDVLIRAFYWLRAQGSGLRAKLLIVGGGSLERKLKRLAKDLSVEDKIEFVGSVPPEKVYEYLQNADIFVRPSRSEGLGSAFLEAMACGIPVIGTPVGGIPDFLKDGEMGLFCKVDDPKDLAEKMLKLMQDEDLYRKLSENGKNLVREKYQWNEIAKRVGEIFLRIQDDKISNT